MQEIVAIWYCHFAKLHNLVKYLSCRRHSFKFCIENYHLLLKLVTKGDLDISSLTNNRMVAAPLALETFKVSSKVWARYIRVIEGHPEGVSIWDGL